MNEGGPELPAKHVVAEALLDEGSLFVHFDPRLPGVVAPSQFKSQPQLVFQFGRGLAVPIPDLLVDEEGISGTLSFSRTPHACFVPWDAVFALVGDDGRGMVFPDSMPGEIRAEIDREAARRAALPPDDERAETTPDAAPDEDARGEELPDNVIHVAFGKKQPPGGPQRGPEGGPPPPKGGPPSLRRIK